MIENPESNTQESMQAENITVSEEMINDNNNSMGEESSNAMTNEGLMEQGEEVNYEEVPAPHKKWAGSFDTPEDLEKQYHRSRQELNELKKQLENKDANKQTNPYEQLFNTEYTESYNEWSRMYPDADEQWLAQMAARDASKEVKRQQRFDNQINSVKFATSPDAKRLEEIVTEVPELNQALESGIPANIVLALDRYYRSKEKNAPRPVPDKRSAGRLTTKSNQASQYNFSGLSKEAVEQYRNGSYGRKFTDAQIAEIAKTIRKGGIQ